MYDEFERAMTGRRPVGMSVVGWLVSGLAFVVLATMVGIGFAVNRAVGDARGVAEAIEGTVEMAALGELESLAELGALAGLEEQLALVSMDADRGLDFVRGLEGRDPAATLVGRALPASDDGRVRIDLQRTESGGSLQIDSDEGAVRFDLVKGEDGGRLSIQSGDEIVRLGLAGEAKAMPAWVPRFGGMPEKPRPVYSLEGSEGVLGAVAWKGSASPADVLSFYRSELEAQGYDLRDEARVSDEGAEEGAFWARSEQDHRVVFVVAHQEHGETAVLLGYGEER